MVRKITLIIGLVLVSLHVEADVYEKNCVKCHIESPINLGQCFNKYLLEYSNEEDMKNKIVDYLLNPDKNNTIMSDAVIDRHGVKQKSKLSKEELKEAVDIYWQKHQVSKKLK